MFRTGLILIEEDRTYVFRGWSLQVNKAQNPQKGLNPSRAKDAKGLFSVTVLSLNSYQCGEKIIEKGRSDSFLSCLFIQFISITKCSFIRVIHWDGFAGAVLSRRHPL